MQNLVRALEKLRFKPEIELKGGDRVIRDACAVLNNRRGNLLLSFELDMLLDICAELAEDDRKILDTAAEQLKRAAIGD